MQRDISTASATPTDWQTLANGGKVGKTNSDAHPEELERPLEEAVSAVLKVAALPEKTELEVLKLLALLEESVPAGGENEA
ncbi:hypothetical protein EIP86_003861 [Pleurotus ostreatoroseus]|nr:hypothetical protein EIP86_003861 [Pleurotus ostreatoroseus]